VKPYHTPHLLETNCTRCELQGVPPLLTMVRV
jgi:hypothetical protein